MPFAPGSMAKGLCVWHDAAGWHVRLTHNEAPGVAPGGTPRPTVVGVRGRVTASRPLVRVRTVRLEDRQRGEWVSVRRPARRATDFRFVNGGHMDGIDFAAGCAGKLTLTAWQVPRDAAGNVVGRTLGGARRLGVDPGGRLLADREPAVAHAPDGCDPGGGPARAAR